MSAGMADVLGIVITVIGSAVIAPLVAFFIKWLSTKTDSEALLTALTEFGDVADGVVAGLQATLVTELREKSADGTLSKEDVAAIVKEGYTQFTDDLSSKSLAVLKKNATDIEGYIRRKIEKALSTAKSNGEITSSTADTVEVTDAPTE